MAASGDRTPTVPRAIETEIPKWTVSTTAMKSDPFYFRLCHSTRLPTTIFKTIFKTIFNYHHVQLQRQEQALVAPRGAHDRNRGSFVEERPRPLPGYVWPCAAPYHLDYIQ
jgi:hypothetical protein